MITGVHSVIIWTEDLQRLTGFYRDVIGFKAQMESEGFVVFEGAPSQLLLGKHSEVHGAARDPNRVMVGLVVDDCQAEYERLRGKGVEFVRPPSKEDDGLTIATFKDVDGNVLQLFQEG